MNGISMHGANFVAYGKMLHESTESFNSVMPRTEDGA